MSLDAVAVKLSTEHADVFVGSKFSDSPYGAPLVYIKGVASASVREIVASSEVAIRVSDGQPYSRDDLYWQRVAIHEALGSTSISGAGSMVAPP